MGTAKYEGSATGRYGRSVRDMGRRDLTDQGLFSADVALEANFGNALTPPSWSNSTLMIEGELSGFMLGDNTTAQNWALNLERNYQFFDDATMDTNGTNAAGVFDGELSLAPRITTPSRAPGRAGSSATLTPGWLLIPARKTIA